MALSLTFTTEGGLGAKWRDPSSDDMVSDWFRTQNKIAIRRREEHESDRLLYVAMTRAEEHLLLSYALGEKDKPAQWAEPVFRIFGMASLEPDAPPCIVSAGLPDGEFSAAVRTITRTPAAVAVEQAGAFSVSGGIQELARPYNRGTGRIERHRNLADPLRGLSTKILSGALSGLGDGAESGIGRVGWSASIQRFGARSACSAGVAGSCRT